MPHPPLPPRAVAAHLREGKRSFCQPLCVHRCAKERRCQLSWNAVCVCGLACVVWHVYFLSAFIFVRPNPVVDSNLVASRFSPQLRLLSLHYTPPVNCLCATAAGKELYARENKFLLPCLRGGIVSQVYDVCFDRLVGETGDQWVFCEAQLRRFVWMEIQAHPTCPNALTETVVVVTKPALLIGNTSGTSEDRASPPRDSSTECTPLTSQSFRILLMRMGKDLVLRTSQAVH